MPRSSRPVSWFCAKVCSMSGRCSTQMSRDWDRPRRLAVTRALLGPRREDLLPGLGGLHRFDDFYFFWSWHSCSSLLRYLRVFSIRSRGRFGRFGVRFRHGLRRFGPPLGGRRRLRGWLQRLLGDDRRSADALATGHDGTALSGATALAPTPSSIMVRQYGQLTPMTSGCFSSNWPDPHLVHPLLGLLLHPHAAAAGAAAQALALVAVGLEQRRRPAACSTSRGASILALVAARGSRSRGRRPGAWARSSSLQPALREQIGEQLGVVDHLEVAAELRDTRSSAC